MRQGKKSKVEATVDGLTDETFKIINHKASQEKLAQVSESFDQMDLSNQSQGFRQMEHSPFRKVTDHLEMRSMHSQLVMQKIVNRDVMGLSAEQESLEHSRDFSKSSRNGSKIHIDTFGETTHNEGMNKTYGNITSKNKFQHLLRSNHKVSNIHIKIENGQEKQYDRAETREYNEHNLNVRPQNTNPWQGSGPSTLVGRSHRKGSESPSSQLSGEKSRASPPLTHFVANGSSLNLKNKQNKQEPEATYTKGLYVSYEEKEKKINSTFAGNINLSAKLNIEIYKAQNQIKSPENYGFNTQVQQANNPSPLFSPIGSKQSSPRHSLQGTTALNMDGQVNRGVQGSQLKSKLKEKNIQMLKGIGEEFSHPIVNTSVKKIQKEGLTPMLNLPPFTYATNANNDFSAQLSGRSVALNEKPVQQFRKKASKTLDRNPTKNQDIDNFMEKVEQKIVKKINDEIRSTIPLSKAKNSFQVSKDGGKTADFEDHQINMEAVQAQISKQDLKGQKLVIIQSRQGRNVNFQDQSMIAEEGLNEIGSQIKLNTAEHSQEELSPMMQFQSKRVSQISGIKYTGSQMTFFDEEKMDGMLQKMSTKQELDNKKQNIIKLHTQQEYLKLISPKMKSGLQQLKVGLQNFSIQHHAQMQDSNEKLLRMMKQNESESGLPIISAYMQDKTGNIPRINVGFSTFETRSRSINDQQKGVAARHQKLKMLHQSSISPSQNSQNLRFVPHHIEAVQLIAKKTEVLNSPVAIDQTKISYEQPDQIQAAMQHAAGQTYFESLGQSGEVVSKQHTLYAESNLQSRNANLKDQQNDSNKVLWVDQTLDKVEIKNNKKGHTFNIDQKGFDNRLDTQGTLSGMDQTKEGFLGKPGVRQMQITTYQLQGTETGNKQRKFGQPKLTGGFQKNMASTKIQKKQSIYNVQNIEIPQILKSDPSLQDFSKTLQHNQHASQSSILDQILSLQESMYQQNNQSQMSGHYGLKRGQQEISERLDDRSTISPTELGFVSNAKYAPVQIINVDTKTSLDLKIKPLQQNPNRPAIQQTTTVFPLDQNEKKLENSKFSKKFNVTLIDAGKQFKTKNPFDNLRDQPQGSHNRNKKSLGLDSKTNIVQSLVDSNLDWQLSPLQKVSNFNSTTTSKKNKKLWADAQHLNGTKTPILDSHKITANKRNSNPFISNAHTNLLEVAQRFANNTHRNAAQSYHSEHTYINAQNNSQYNSKYQFESKKFSKVKIAEGNEIIKPTQLEIGGEGAPMLSLLPPLMTREISPRYKSTIDRKKKAVRNANEATAQIKKELLLSGKRSQLPQSKQLTNSDLIMSNDLKKSFLNGGFEIAQSGSVSGDSRSRSPDERNTRLENNDDLMQTIQQPLSKIQMDRISVLIHSEAMQANTQGMGDHQAQSHSQEQIDNLMQQEQYQNQYKRAEQINELTKQLRRDVIIQPEHQLINQQTAYQRRQLNLDGTWKEKSNNLKDKSFLEYVHSSNFKNPLDAKNQFGFSTISPDRLFLLNRHIDKKPSITHKKPKLPPQIQLTGISINTKQRVVGFDQSGTIKNSYQTKMYYDEEKTTKEDDDEEKMIQKYLVTGLTNYLGSGNIVSPKSLLDDRSSHANQASKLMNPTPFLTRNFMGQGSQVSLNSNSDRAEDERISPTLTYQAFESQAFLRNSPTLKQNIGSQLSDIQKKSDNRGKPGQSVLKILKK